MGEDEVRLPTYPKVWVLGSDGMLGRTMVRELGLQGLEVVQTTRRIAESGIRPDERILFDAKVFLDTLESPNFEENDVVVNCIGIIRAQIDSDSLDSTLLATKINSEFPLLLAQAVRRKGALLIQIATDCVFSGKQGKRDESSEHDATDVYGKTKSLGEPRLPGVLNLRCSIVGRENLGGGKSLLEWVLSHPLGATLNGFTNHIWNGLTTNAFARIVAGIIKEGQISSGTYHVVPSNQITKHQLLVQIAQAFHRQDLKVIPFEAPQGKDMTLGTKFPEMNARFWEQAGYPEIPSIENLIKEISHKD